jgi:hypothetical protein
MSQPVGVLMAIAALKRYFRLNCRIFSWVIPEARRTRVGYNSQHHTLVIFWYLVPCHGVCALFLRCLTEKKTPRGVFSLVILMFTNPGFPKPRTCSFALGTPHAFHMTHPSAHRGHSISLICFGERKSFVACISPHMPLQDCMVLGDLRSLFPPTLTVFHFDSSDER